jgi:hypothetical protein
MIHDKKETKVFILNITEFKVDFLFCVNYADPPSWIFEYSIKYCYSIEYF